MWELGSCYYIERSSLVSIYITQYCFAIRRFGRPESDPCRKVRNTIHVIFRIKRALSSCLFAAYMCWPCGGKLEYQRIHSKMWPRWCEGEGLNNCLCRTCLPSESSCVYSVFWIGVCQRHYCDLLGRWGPTTSSPLPQIGYLLTRSRWTGQVA